MDTIDNDNLAAGTPPAHIPEPVVNEMRAATPWMKFMCILGFVYCIFLVVGGVFALSASGNMVGSLVIFITYAIIVLLVLIPNLLLFQYARHLDLYGRSRAYGDLLTAFVKQKRFWRFVGIVSSILISLFIILAVIAMLMGNVFDTMQGF